MTKRTMTIGGNADNEPDTEEAAALEDGGSTDAAEAVTVEDDASDLIHTDKAVGGRFVMIGGGQRRFVADEE